MDKCLGREYSTIFFNETSEMPYDSVLTLRSRVGVRRQSVARQVSRPREEVVAVRKVPTRGGV
jgi:hypothetical protein